MVIARGENDHLIIFSFHFYLSPLRTVENQIYKTFLQM